MSFRRATAQFWRTVELVQLVCELLDRKDLHNMAQVSRLNQELSYKRIWTDIRMRDFVRILPTNSIRDAVHHASPKLLRRITTSLFTGNYYNYVPPSVPLTLDRKLSPEEWTRIQEISGIVRSLKIELRDCRGHAHTMGFYTPFILSFPGRSLFPRLKSLSLHIDFLFASCEPFLLHILSSSPLSELRITVRAIRHHWQPELISLVFSLLTAIPGCCPDLKLFGLLYKHRELTFKANITHAVLNGVGRLPQLKTLILSNITLPNVSASPISYNLHQLKEFCTYGVESLSRLVQVIQNSSPNHIETLSVADISIPTTGRDLEQFLVSLRPILPRLQHLHLEREMVYRPSDQTPRDTFQAELSNFLPLSSYPELRKLSLPDNTFGFSRDFLNAMGKMLPDTFIDLVDQSDEFSDEWFDLI